MLDLITVVLDIFAKFFNPTEVAKLRKEKKLQELGSELFLFYINLNQILVYGESIVDCLEVYLNRMQNHLLTGNDPYAVTAGNWVAPRVREQITNINKLVHQMERVQYQLQVLDANTFFRLQVLIDVKFGALQRLMMVMRNSLPMLENDMLEKLLLSDLDDQETRLNPQVYAKKQKFQDKIEEQSVSYDVPWDKEIYAHVERYITLRNPRRQLDEIRSALQQLNIALKENFSTQDILLAVGDERFGTRWL